MIRDGRILAAYSEDGRCFYLEPSMANRHGLIAGATGTGKSVTLKALAESFSDLGVPVFLADVKGDLSGLCRPGAPFAPKVASRLEAAGILGELSFRQAPVRFWDVLARDGIPVRTTISEMGPTLLARLLGLNDTQEGVLSLVFRIADDEGLLILDMKDLRSMCAYVGEHARDYLTTYGNISAQTIGAIQRKLLALEDQGADIFFGEPALDIFDWMRTAGPRGMINILHSVELIGSPVMYSTFLLWMMAELYERLPEAGDLDRPKMVFFFDEAHLLFDGTPRALLEQIERVVRLIRSKGVGIYFVTQSPSDIPDVILAQLGNRIQHAIRAYTPKEQKAIKAIASSYRPNPAFDTKDAIAELGTGEALVSFLDDEGRPSVVERAYITPPASSMAAADPSHRELILSGDALIGKYQDSFDRESAYEILTARAKQIMQQQEAQRQAAAQRSAPNAPQPRTPSRPSRTQKSITEKAIDSAVTSIGRSLGTSLVRGLMGRLFR